MNSLAIRKSAKIDRMRVIIPPDAVDSCSSRLTFGNASKDWKYFESFSDRGIFVRTLSTSIFDRKHF